jgi:hypothetical protein
MDITAFNLARMELPEVRAMAELYPIDQIFDKSRLSDASIERVYPRGYPRVYT